MKADKKIFYITVLTAFMLQTLFITYNNYTGFIKISGIVNFFERLIIGGVFSSIFGFGIISADLILLKIADKFTPWEGGIIKRTLVEILLIVSTGITGGCSLTLLAHVIFPYKDLISILIANSLITIVVNCLIVVVLEAVINFKRKQEIAYKAEKLEKENTQIRFQTLKEQLNPHFLFNSLNVLSALIKKDADKAQNFVDEFSLIYRYILEVIEKPVISLREEIKFAKSYLYLQQIRFEDALKYDINIDASKLESFVPPLSVQTLVENAIKHNKAQSDKPLNIHIYSNGEYLIIENNVQLKKNNVISAKVGLENLTKRYSYISGSKPEFFMTEDKYIAKIPLIYET